MRRFPVFLAGMLLSLGSFAAEIFLHEVNATSYRIGVFQDDNDTAFLYLTHQDNDQPEFSVVAYTHTALSPANTSGTADGKPPRLTMDTASPQAFIHDIDERELSLKWSRDGQALAILRKGTPIAYISAKDKTGYSKALVRSSPLGQPWDEKRYRKLFK